jgi:hypothetical protein
MNNAGIAAYEAYMQSAMEKRIEDWSKFAK